MLLTDTKIQRHLRLGGKIIMRKVAWAYAKLDHDQLSWYEARSGKFVACVEAFSEVTSRDWEPVFEVFEGGRNENSVRGPGRLKIVQQ